MSAPVFIVHNRAQALALRALAAEVEILIPRHVTITGGPGFVRYLIEGLDPPPWVDCADFRGHALGLIREGIPRLIFDGSPAILAKLSDIGAQSQTLVTGPLAVPRVVLRAEDLHDKILSRYLVQAGFTVKLA